MAETVIFNGRKYRRYPKSKHAAHRRYFSRSRHWLHRDIWIHHNGPIPDGHEVHHKDRDTLNNDPSNLECLSEAEHFAAHSADLSARASTPEHLAHLAVVRPMTVEWHRSEEGRAWHRENAKTSLHQPGQPKPYSKSHYIGVCAWCGKEFEARSRKKEMCGPRCVEAKYRLVSGKTKKRGPNYKG